MVHEGADRPSFVLNIAAPNRKMAPLWGDFHMAEALGRALRARGHRVRIQTADEWESLDGLVYDVRIHLKGLATLARVSTQLHVIWNISHPMDLTVEEVRRRRPRPRRIRTVRRPSQVADEDTGRGPPAGDRPPPVPSDAARSVPASRRGVRRQASRGVPARGAGRDRGGSAARRVGNGMVGGSWTPRWSMVVYVRNAELAVLYSSVAVLLNDHHEEMREWGFVSNRVFDALACGAMVLSDHLPGDPGAVWRCRSDLLRSRRPAGKDRRTPSGTGRAPLSPRRVVRSCSRPTHSTGAPRSCSPSWSRC